MIARIKTEADVFHVRLVLAKFLMWPLPPFFGGVLRAAILRLAGFQVGPHTVFWGSPTLVGSGKIQKKLRIGSHCKIGMRSYIDLSGPVIFEDYVALGPEVMIFTGTHNYEDPTNRTGGLEAKPVCIGAGTWVGARCTILPGVRIGPGVVVAAGAVVTQDVPANTLVAGVPAVVKRHLKCDGVTEACA